MLAFKMEVHDIMILVIKLDLYRNTYVKINLKNIKENVSKIINKYNNYKYYFGVVKADCYGHFDLEVVETIINGGCNYLVVALLEEALIIRERFKDIPILCLGVVHKEHLDVCIKNNITITINSLSYIKDIIDFDLKGLRTHIKVNTGMNRFGVSSKDEFNQVYNLIKDRGLFLEGIYTHIYNASNELDTQNQFTRFNEIVEDIDIKSIPIIHIAASETLINYSKDNNINGCRLGIIMYGFTKDKTLDLKSTFSLYSEVVQINELNKGDTVGYNGSYKALERERIAVISIGYADGIIRKNTGRYVYIKNKRYPIIGNVCMDVLFVRVDDDVKLYDEVVILKDINHIEEVSNYLETIPYEVICSIGKRVPRIYIK
jgi:alanine racemase